MYFKTKASQKYKAIPTLMKTVAGWKSVPILECREELVPVGPFSDYPELLQDSMYWGERISSPYGTMELNGSLITPFLRKNVAERLVNASKLLPKRHAFLIWDSYRPLEVQQALFQYYLKQLQEQGVENALEEAQKFVSIPSSDPTKPSPHNTGGVVDLTIVKFDRKSWRELKKLNKIITQSEDWKEVFSAEMRKLYLVRKSEILPMGTRFDEVSEKTETRFFEKNTTLTTEEKEYLQNRRLLYHALISEGFESYEGEWWHFSYGDQWWGVKNGVTAIYGSADFSKGCERWEKMRRDHFLGSERIWKREYETTRLWFSDLFYFVRDEVHKNGDLKESMHPKGCTL